MSLLFAHEEIVHESFISTLSHQLRSPLVAIVLIVLVVIAISTGYMKFIGKNIEPTKAKKAKEEVDNE